MTKLNAVSNVQVTDWQSYTPTVTNLGSGSGTALGFYRRVGDTVQVSISFSKDGTAGSGGALVNFSVPTEVSGLYNTSASASGEVGFVINNTDTPVIRYGVVISGAGGLTFQIRSPASALTGSSFTAGSNWVLSASYPIVGWSSNLTSGARAVEEYAFNTNTADADDTTSFGYGSIGVQFGNFSTGRTKRVRFLSQIQPTDSLFIEILQNGGWLSLSSYGTGLTLTQTYEAQGTNTYGLTVQRVLSSSTDVDVTFGAFRLRSASTSYAATGVGWGGAVGAGLAWRVRKVSSGASVGYPISASNVLVSHDVTQVSNTIKSGTFTPVNSSPVNISAVTMQTASYLRVGNVVTMGGQFSFTTTANNTASSTELTIPEITTNFAGATACAGAGGTITAGAVAGNSVPIYVESVGSTQRIKLYWTSGPSIAGTTQVLTYSVTFRIA